MNPRFLLGLLAAALLQAPSRSAEPADGPIVIPRALRHDFTSRVNGRRYRLQVATPFRSDPAKAYPAFYVLDGNWYFLAAAENVTEAASTITPAIVVGVGYPTDDNDEVGKRRLFELTPTAGNAGWGKGGGGDAFLRVGQGKHCLHLSKRFCVTVQGHEGIAKVGASAFQQPAHLRILRNQPVGLLEGVHAALLKR